MDVEKKFSRQSSFDFVPTNNEPEYFGKISRKRAIGPVDKTYGELHLYNGEFPRNGIRQALVHEYRPVVHYSFSLVSFPICWVRNAARIRGSEESDSHQQKDFSGSATQDYPTGKHSYKMYAFAFATVVAAFGVGVMFGVKTL